MSPIKEFPLEIFAERDEKLEERVRERGKFIKSLSTIVSAGEAFAANGMGKARRKARRRRG